MRAPSVSDSLHQLGVGVEQEVISVNAPVDPLPPWVVGFQLLPTAFGQALFLGTFSVVFRALLHASTMSQMIPDIHSYLQIFPVSEGMSF